MTNKCLCVALGLMVLPSCASSPGFASSSDLEVPVMKLGVHDGGQTIGTPLEPIPTRYAELPVGAWYTVSQLVSTFEKPVMQHEAAIEFEAGHLAAGDHFYIAETRWVENEPWFRIRRHTDDAPDNFEYLRVRDLDYVTIESWSPEG